MLLTHITVLIKICMRKQQTKMKKEKKVKKKIHHTGIRRSLYVDVKHESH